MKFHTLYTIREICRCAEKILTQLEIESFQSRDIQVDIYKSIQNSMHGYKLTSNNCLLYTMKIREVWPVRVRRRIGSVGSVMGNYVVRHCPSPITVIVMEKYLVQTTAVIG